ncbi:MAG TPA: response regulator [Pirellulales bacterium]
MPKRVLDVGQCDPDHGTIRNYLSQHFDVLVDRAKLPAEALSKLRAGAYDLVLVNRKLDEDYSDGLEIIKSIKADPAIAAVPVMLVTNYPDQQDVAVSAGAIRGFGKLEYQKPETREKLAAVLGG